MQPEKNDTAPKTSADVRQFMQLYAGKERCIYKYIYTLVHDEVAADDILQDTVMVMLTKFHVFKPGTNFVAWAIRIAYYQALKFHTARNKKLVFNSDLIEELAQRAAVYTHQESHQQMALQQCLQKLTQRDRHLIELRYQEGDAVSTIAQKLDRHVKGVYNSLNRIRWQLLECIQRHRAVEDRV